MSLLLCPSCGKEITRKTIKCYFCGHVAIDEKNTKSPLLFIPIVVFFVVLSISIFLYNDRDDGTSPHGKSIYVMGSELRIGMGKSYVIQLIGYPYKINKTYLSNGDSEQWVMKEDMKTILYFTNNKLSAAQTN